MNLIFGIPRIASHFWPGFRKAWDCMDHQAAMVAILFAWCSIFVGLNCFYWAQWYPSWIVNCLLAALVITSLAHGVRPLLLGQSQTVPRLNPDLASQVELNFRLAQESYLQGDYFEAEQHLLKNLSVNDADIESALLLSSVYRRSGKFGEALETLNQLQLRDGAIRWGTEIVLEKERVIRTKRQSLTIPPPKA
ncbi:tetratricopeptide repeat protein [Pirellulaceae bacterium SH449]